MAPTSVPFPAPPGPAASPGFPRLAAPPSPVLTARAEPSYEQTRRACASLSEKAFRDVEAVKGLFDYWAGTGRDLGDQLREGSELAGQLIAQAEATLDTALSQCREHLPAATIRELERLRGELAGYGRKLDEALRGPGVDWNALASRIRDGLGAGFTVLGGLLVWLLTSPFRRPATP